MNYYAGIDVSLEALNVCVIDANGKIFRESKVASEPEALIVWFASLGVNLTRIGLEAGPLSQWLYAAMRQAALAVDPGQKRDPGERIPCEWTRGIDKPRPVTEERNKRSALRRSLSGGTAGARGARPAFRRSTDFRLPPDHHWLGAGSWPVDGGLKRDPR
jgi:hypothetical protein